MTAPRAELPDERETYVVQIDDVSPAFGEWVGSVVNVATGRAIGTWKTPAGHFRIALGEKLCAACDAPIADGPCGCMRKSP
jgi:hypothetical protein